MMPALVDQERIFINKFVYKFGIDDIERGDMVVFWFPGDPTKSYIKRVIGLPGDTIEVDDGTVRVNGQALQEDYILDEYRDRMPMSPFKIGPEEYFVLRGSPQFLQRQPLLGSSPGITSTAKPSSSIGLSVNSAFSTEGVPEPALTLCPQTLA